MGVSGGPSIPQSGMQLNLDAGNIKSAFHFDLGGPGNGLTWYDVSGNGRDFTWSSAPTYYSGTPKSIDSLRASGPPSNSFGIDNSSGYTIIFIAIQDAATNSAAFEFHKDGVDSGDTRGIFAHVTWGNGYIYFDQGGCCGSNERTNTTVSYYSDTDWKTFGFTSNAGNSRQIWVNGVSVKENTVAAKNIDLNSTAVWLGGADGYTNWNAKMGVFIVYNRELTATEMMQIHNAHRERFGI